MEAWKQLIIPENWHPMAGVHHVTPDRARNLNK
jgi:hypothetical protein